MATDIQRGFKSLVPRHHTLTCAAQAFTLTEVAIIVGIIGIILAALWTAASMAREAYNVHKLNSEIASLVSNYISFYTMRGPLDASGDVTCSGVTAGLIPIPMGGQNCDTSTMSNYPTNPWGGSVQIVADNVRETIEVSQFGIPQSSCIKMLHGLINIQQIIQIDICPNIQFPIISECLFVQLPLNPKMFPQYCNAPTNVIQVFYSAH